MTIYEVIGMIVGIIGGGASGMAAALAASNHPHVQVLLFERQARVGRKLLATGNGRCNLTNLHANGNSYHGTAPEFAQYALSQMDPQATLQWFSDLGLYTVSEPSGRVYPYSDQANSVVDVLRLGLERPNVQLITGYDVQRIKKTEEGFLISDGETDYTADKLIIACGGLAGTKLGGTMSGYKLLAKFGHRSTKLRPTLVQLKSSWSALAALKGVRANCHVQILHEGELFSQSTGEVQFTDYGLSGPVIFEISRDVCAKSGTWVAVLDLLPQLTRQQLLKELLRRKESALPVQELLTGILHNRLGRVLTQAVGIPMNLYCRELSQVQLEAVCNGVKQFEVTLTEPMGMENAQVTAGGVLTDQFCDRTMESKLVPGLYACGEVLDIDGDCGGYNLQWAWSSGYLAGSAAGKEV